MKRKNGLSLLGAVVLACSLTANVFAAPEESGKTNGDAALHDVALGAPYTVSQGYRDDSLMGYENNRSKPGLLTNGKYGAAGTAEDFLDPEWIGYLRQVSREVVIDLGDTKSIDQIKVDLLQHGTVGIGLPKYINYYLSDDNQTWHRVDSTRPVTQLTQGGSRETTGSKELKTAARYVKVEFEVGTFAFVDEIEVLGSDTAAEKPKPLSGPLQQPVEPEGMLKSGTPQTGGVENMYLAYLYPYGTYPNDTLSKWTKDDFLRVVTHTDPQGNPTGRMFDTMLFNVGGGKSEYDTQAKWTAFLDMAFAGGINLNALDEAAAQANAALKDGKKVKVVLPIPYPDPKAKGPWGIVDGQEISLNVDAQGEDQSLVNRIKAVNWMVKETERRFRQAGFRNLELTGFYWVWEEVGYDSANEGNLIKAAARIVHDGEGNDSEESGKKLYWIPFYQANGFTQWKELGFDVVMMQPNYYFNGGMGPSPQAGPESDLSRLRNTAALAERFGIGVEMEGDYQMMWKKTANDYDGTPYNGVQAVQKFYNYMNVFTETGLNQSVVGYYLGARTVLQEIIDSKTPYVRAAYDDAYLFTRDVYQPKQPDLPPAPLPGEGDDWGHPIQLAAKEGDAYISSVGAGESKWLKFPIGPVEDWVVTLTPDAGAAVGLETRMWAETQTPHTGFSYLGGQTQSLLVSNRNNQAQAVMLRVFANDSGGGYTLSLRKATEDGASKMNALPLKPGTPIQNTVKAGQEVWYKVSGASTYQLKLVPTAGADMDMELFWGSNYSDVLAGSYNGPGQPETFSYSNPYATDFVYFVKVKAKTDGTFTLSSE